MTTKRTPVRGISGYSGYSGLSTSGYSGLNGASGYSGYNGVDGASGYSGVAGESGFIGISGYSGIGVSGYSGASGLSGYSSYSGISGYSSYSGRSGYSGTSGLRGADGYSGRSGYSGIAGNSGYLGFSGYSGISGSSGYSGIGISGYSGKSGYSGSTGTSGYSGFSSYSGIRGIDGSSGYSGRSGLSGISGYSGITPASGASGYSGQVGISGYSGTSGLSSYSGYSGDSGYSGIVGWAGFSGYSGESGFRGASGYSGTSGLSSYSGISGYSGESGISGYSGEFGISGYSGVIGISGYSGIQAGSGQTLLREINQPSHDLAVQQIVRFDGTNYVRAQANSVFNAEVAGIVSEYIDPDNFVLTEYGYVSGLSGLTPGLVYYLSVIYEGVMVDTDEAVSSGYVSKPVLIAISDNEGYFVNWRGQEITPEIDTLQKLGDLIATGDEQIPEDEDFFTFTDESDSTATHILRVIKYGDLKNIIVPIATETTLGGVKVGDGLEIDGSGVLSVHEPQTDHNYLNDLQGGDSTSLEYYHLTSEEYDRVNPATETTLGVVKVGDGLTVEEDGTINAVDPILDHNLLENLQGGDSTSSEYYHFTEDEHTFIQNLIFIGEWK